ncbi:MAG: 1-acyl-sn-glycerol-3-phosphate acyltransferase [bacterium]
MRSLSHLLSLRVWVHLILLRPLLRLGFGVNVAGRENLAGLKQYILAANHNSHLDTLLLFDLLPARHIIKTRPVAAADHFARHKLLFKIADYLFRPIWITRQGRTRQSVAEMKAQLNSGGNVIIFPEGTRGTPGQIGEFKTGVGELAAAFRDIPVVPVFLSGPEKSLPKGSSFPVPIWNHVTVGPPQVLLGERPDITACLEKIIRELAESETANRHRRKKPAKPIFSVTVVGVDGSGKSTLSQRLAIELSANMRTCLISDGVEFYEHGDRAEVQSLLVEKLREAVGRYAKRARSLKHYKIPKMTELLLRERIMGEVRRWYSPDVLVLDGCPIINLTAWAIVYKEAQFDPATCASAMRILSGEDDEAAPADDLLRKFPEIAAIKSLGLARMRIPDAVIMLDVDPSVCIERIKSRGKDRQAHETQEKLAKLREGYLMVCDVIQKQFGVPVRIIRGDAQMGELTSSGVTFIKQCRAERSAHD